MISNSNNTPQNTHTHAALLYTFLCCVFILSLLTRKQETTKMPITRFVLVAALHSLCPRGQQRRCNFFVCFFIRLSVEEEEEEEANYTKLTSEHCRQKQQFF